MKRESAIIKRSDSKGSYEIEIFDAPNPKNVIVCSHGNGVRRWDGEHFFYEVAEHCGSSAVFLVDQNQPERDGVRLNPLPILVSRVQELITEAKTRYPEVPIVVLAHSMGCAVASYLDLTDVSKVIFEAPGAGKQGEALVERYGEDILNGKAVTTTDGLYKNLPKEYVDSVRNLDWRDAYADLLARYKPVYVFEAGDEEIVTEERLEFRNMPFKKYEIIPKANHNLAGEPLKDFLGRLDRLLEQ